MFVGPDMIFDTLFYAVGKLLPNKLGLIEPCLCEKCKQPIETNFVAVGFELTLDMKQPSETEYLYYTKFNQVFFCIKCAKGRCLVPANGNMITHFLAKLDMIAANIANVNKHVYMLPTAFSRTIQIEFEKQRSEILKQVSEYAGICTFCGVPNPKKVCSKCCIERYCDAKCQLAHWKKQHKNVCDKIAHQPFFQELLECTHRHSVIVPMCFYVTTTGICGHCAKDYTDGVFVYGYQFFLAPAPNNGNGFFISGCISIILCSTCSESTAAATTDPRYIELARDEELMLINSFVQDFLHKMKPETVEPVEETLAKFNTKTPKLFRRIGKNSLCHFCRTKNPMYRCENCQITRYCDSECQLKDWEAHKLQCKWLGEIEIFQLDKMIRIFHK